MIDKLKSAASSGGSSIIVALTDEVPIPAEQSYLHLGLLVSVADLRAQFCDWEIVSFETGRLLERHHLADPLHEHGVVRLLARKMSQRAFWRSNRRLTLH